jgi:corrinoid protein of di/trimethylamine methyltransferase
MDNEILEKLSQAVLLGDMDGVPGMCQEAVNAGYEPMVIINDGMAPGAREAGVKFSNGEYFLPQLVLAGEAMKGGLEILLPLITAEARAQAKGVVVIGSVEGDVHDIGKNIVSALLIANGFQVTDLGIDVPTSVFVERAKSENADIVAMGSYMSTTLPQMRGVVDALKEAGFRDRLKVMVGGAAVTEAFAEEIGADGFGEDAAEAVEKAIELVGGE